MKIANRCFVERVVGCLVLSACSDGPAATNHERDTPPVQEPVAEERDEDGGRTDARATATTDAADRVRDASPRRDTGAPVDPAPTDAGTSTPVDASEPPPFEGAGETWTKPAPRAACASGDMSDGTLSGLNGNVRCNLELAGQVAAPHFLSLAWYKDCAYVNGSEGTTVVQVSESGTPTVTATLTQAGFRSNWETMKASATSGLLAGYESNGPVLAVYDLKQDCAHPALQSSTILTSNLGIGSIGHAGSFSPDGTIYYASSMYTSEVFAVDLAMPQTPSVITSTFDRGAHDLFIGKGGNRGYFAAPNVASLGIGSFAILDLTQVQARTPNAKGTLIKELTWEDGNISQYPIAISYRGVDHLLITDELGSGACDNAQKPQWGYARIFDIHDERDPKLVSLIKTEAQDFANCNAAGSAQGSTLGFGLGTHYCNVDRLDDPRLLACGNWDGGVRVYDIRNPWRPKELAYFDVQGEGVPGLVRIHVEKRELWLATTPGTFYVLKWSPESAIAQVLQP